MTTTEHPTLRQNPDTGRLAELIAAECIPNVPLGERWFTYQWDVEVGLTVELLSDADVADWVPVEVRPA